MNDKKYTSVLEAIHNRESGLSEVRTRLLQAIEKLKASRNFLAVQGKQLKDFWNKEYPPAPFEELFTLKQIAEINIDTFFKKRSLVPAKIMGIVASIENAISKAGSKEKKPRKEKKTKSKSSKAPDKIERLMLQYNLLISKCRMMNEILDISGNLPEIANSRVTESLTKDLKKIDKLLAAHHVKLSKLI